MAKKTSTNASGEAKKIFVLDTSVILHDHNAVQNFQEHDIAIPITVLEELDNFKKGNDILNYEARSFIRYLDKLAGQETLQNWIPLGDENKGNIRVLMHHNVPPDYNAETIFGDDKPDHKIINSTFNLQKEYPDQKVVLVSKDINLRLKAKSLNLLAEDYAYGKVANVSSLYSGKTTYENVNPDIINQMYQEGYCKPAEVTDEKLTNNHFFILKSEKNSTLAYYNPETELIEQINKQSVYGIKPRNAEQTFAISAIMNSNIKLVTLQGVAGTGKTLLALASAMEQKQDYKQIYIARPIVPLSNKDLGYLPGDVKSKLNPHMEPLWDNLKFIQNQFDENSKENQKITDMVNNEKILITPLAYIRGRSLSNIIFIVDEAQNLTPHEIKTIITRSGENTKIIFTGDVHQIDTPFLDSESNGLSYLIDRLKGQSIYAHITLEKGERSELANLANDLL